MSGGGVCLFCRFPGAGVGDLVQRNIFLHLLRRAFPHARLTWVLSEDVTGAPLLDELVRGHSYATDVLACPSPGVGDRRWRRFLDGLPARGFDVCVVDPRSVRLGVREAWRAGISVRAAVPTGGPDDPLITHPLRLPQPADLYDYAAALTAALCPQLPMPPPEQLLPPLPMPGRGALPPAPPAVAAASLAAPAVLRRPFVGLHPSCSAGWNRRWPQTNFAQLGARAADELGAALAVLGSAAEAADAARLRAEILQHCPGAHVQLCLGQSLPQLAALIATMDLLVGNDSGPAHLAAALGTPTVVAYGPDGEDAMWGRVYPRHRGINLHYPCHDRPNDDRVDGATTQCALGCPCDYTGYDGPYPRCLTDISVDHLWRLVHAQLSTP